MVANFTLDSFLKWPVVKCKALTSKNTINVTWTVCKIRVAGNNFFWQRNFLQKNLKIFVKCSINYLKSVPYHPRSNGLVERFINVFKRAIKRANGIEAENEEVQKFLLIYQITRNVNASRGKAPAELIFTRKIHSVFNKLIPSKNKLKESKNTLKKFYRPGEKIYFLNYHLGKAIWIESIIKKRIGKMMFVIKHPWNVWGTQALTNSTKPSKQTKTYPDWNWCNTLMARDCEYFIYSGLYCSTNKRFNSVFLCVSLPSWYYTFKCVQTNDWCYCYIAILETI